MRFLAQVICQNDLSFLAYKLVLGFVSCLPEVQNQSDSPPGSDKCADWTIDQKRYSLPTIVVPDLSMGQYFCSRGIRCTVEFDLINHTH